MAAEPVSEILWRERRLLQQLEVLLASSHPPARAVPAGQEVELIVLALQRAELARAVAAQDLADELGRPGPVPLSVLAAELPAPWGLIFERHRRALVRHLARAPAGMVPLSLRESVA